MTVNDYNYSYIGYEQVSTMVYDSPPHIREFTQALNTSFSEFRENYRRYLLQRDETAFRKAGHKIKPVAQMFGIEEILQEYEHAKTLLWEEKEQELLERSSDRIDTICDAVLTDLRHITDTL